MKDYVFVSSIKAEIFGIIKFDFFIHPLSLFLSGQEKSQALTSL